MDVTDSNVVVVYVTKCDMLVDGGNINVAVVVTNRSVFVDSG